MLSGTRDKTRYRIWLKLALGIRHGRVHGRRRQTRLLHPGHPADLRKQLLEVPRRRRAAFQARSAHSRHGAEGRHSGARRSFPERPRRAGCTGVVAGLEKPAMPLDGKLTAAQISIIRDWIDQGAVWDDDVRNDTAAAAPLAALEEMPIPPEARNYLGLSEAGRVRPPGRLRQSPNPIDRFLEKARRERASRPRRAADRITLLRRAYLDLIGLPPTPAETAEFLADNQPARLGEPDRQTARLAALRRALGTALAGRGALRRFQRLRARYATGPTPGAIAIT